MQNDNNDNDDDVSGGGNSDGGDLGGDNGDVAGSPTAAQDFELPGKNMSHLIEVQFVHKINCCAYPKSFSLMLVELY